MLTAEGFRRRVVVVQPYVAAYRAGFFDRLQARLGAEGVGLEVLHGPPPPGQAARQDAALCTCATQVPVRRLSGPGGRSLAWHRVRRQVAAADVVVLEQALHNLEAYPLLLRQRVRRTAEAAPRVAFWGHGRTYTKAHTNIEVAVKEALTRRGAWFFAYTDGGAAHIASRGFPNERITVVRNSVDTTALTGVRDRAARPGTQEYAEAARLRRRYGLIRGRTALFLGGLDTPKRIPFLLESARQVAAGLSGFRLLVAGDGVDRALVDIAASMPGSPVVAVGRAEGRHTGLLGAVSDIMMMPGRVGLCAVDSFALRTPVVTTDWSWHAPEFEYLAHGLNALVAPDDVAAYAAAVTVLLRDPPRLESLSAVCRENVATYSLESMVARFCDGLLRLLAEESGRKTWMAASSEEVRRRSRPQESVPHCAGGSTEVMGRIREP
jgi:glycosyltransferase involved in cell wall biosynthesis